MTPKILVKPPLPAACRALSCLVLSCLALPRLVLAWLLFATLAAGALTALAATPKKPHTVALGPARSMPYSKVGDPAGALPDETTLRTRPLIVDGRLTEWTTGEMHDVTDRSFVVRRALKINDALPSDKKPGGAWVWQRGPWILVDRVTGHITALRLPEYDPAASSVAWFRDYAAYCGVTATGKNLYAVVAQLAVRKPLLQKKLSSYDPENHPEPVCPEPTWQRDPLRVTFQPTGQAAASFNVVGNSAVLVEDGDEDPDPSKP